MKFTQTLTDDDKKEFFNLYYSNEKQYSTIIVNGVMFTIIGVLSPFISSSKPFMLYALSFLCVLVGYGSLVYKRRMIKASIALAHQEKNFGKTQDIEITETKFYLNTLGTKVEMNLDMFIGYHSGESLCILYLTENKAYLFKRDALKEEASEEQLVAFLEGAGVNPMYRNK